MTSGPDLVAYRQQPREQERIASLFSLLPETGASALDVGARDGHISRLLARRYADVTALDLVQPAFTHPRVRTVAGDVTALQFGDRAFDVVVCTEVLEHIPGGRLADACRELARVTRGHLLIGVPNEQDLRADQNSCAACGRTSPPYGHVNEFSVDRVRTLFPTLKAARVALIGRSEGRTNWLSAALMSFAGNPWGTYGQEEPCVHCAAPLVRPTRISRVQKAAARLAFGATRLQRACSPVRANWIHVLFVRPEQTPEVA